MSIVLIEVTVYDPAQDAERVVRVATEPYAHPSAPGPYDDALAEQSDPFITREIFRDGVAFGAGATDRGEILLDNLDGAYDWLLGCYRDGRSVRLLVGERDAAYDTFAVFFSGTAAAIDVGDQVAVRLHDRFTEVLDQPLSEASYAGTGGAEGTEDFTGRAAGVVEGYALLVPGDLVDPADQVVCIADRGPVALVEARIRGQVIPPGVQRATLADLLATAPASGVVDWYPGSASERAYLRVGSALDGEVAATITKGATTADRTAGQVFARLLDERAGITVDAVDVADLDAAAPGEVGGWWTGTDTLRRALDEVAGTVGAGYWQDREGTWRIRRIEAPGTPVLTLTSLSIQRAGGLTDADIVDCRPLFTSRADGGIQPWQVRLNFARNYTAAEKGQFAGVAEADLDRLSREWLEAVTPAAAAAPIRAAHPMSVPMTGDTLFRERTPATDEAVRRQALFADRQRFAVSVALTPEVAALLDLGVTVRVEFPAFGLDAGRDMVVTRIRHSILTGIAEITVWG